MYLYLQEKINMILTWTLFGNMHIFYRFNETDIANQMTSAYEAENQEFEYR